MSKTVRIVNGVVAEIMLVPEGFNLADCYAPPLIEQCVEGAPDDVKPGWLFDGKTFSTPAAPQPSASDLVAYAAAARYAKEVGGITVGTATIDTSRGSQAMITASYVAARQDDAFSTSWKGADGKWTKLNAAAMISLGDAVLAHVKACFAIEADVDAKIASGTIKTIADVDVAFSASSASPAS